MIPLHRRRRRGIMDITELQNNKLHVERAKIMIFKLLTQCIKDIDDTVKTSGLTMRDVGVGVEKYITGEDSYIIELRLKM
jgi:hypothetical protein